MRSFRPNRTDANQREIVRELGQLKIAVFDLSAVGMGFPDLIVARPGFNLLVEIKGAKGKLTDAQVTFHRIWPGPKAVARTTEEVLAALRHYDPLPRPPQARHQPSGSISLETHDPSTPSAGERS